VVGAGDVVVSSFGDSAVVGLTVELAVVADAPEVDVG
jgi:hypothetical protein